jgi:hypothetical protein
MYKVEQINVNTIKLIKMDINMDDYNEEVLENGDIILTKKLKDTSILNIWLKIDTFESWLNYDLHYKYLINLKYSKIISCSINNNKIDDDKLHYHLILYDVYNIIKDYNKIIERNYINLLNEKGSSDYHYIEELNISFPKVYLGYSCFNELVHQCKNNNIKLDILILLNNKRYIQFILN